MHLPVRHRTRATENPNLKFERIIGCGFGPMQNNVGGALGPCGILAARHKLIKRLTRHRRLIR